MFFDGSIESARLARVARKFGAFDFASRADPIAGAGERKMEMGEWLLEGQKLGLGRLVPDDGGTFVRA